MCKVLYNNNLEKNLKKMLKKHLTNKKKCCIL